MINTKTGTVLGIASDSEASPAVKALQAAGFDIAVGDVKELPADCELVIATAAGWLAAVSCMEGRRPAAHGDAPAPISSNDWNFAQWPLPMIGKWRGAGFQ